MVWVLIRSIPERNFLWVPTCFPREVRKMLCRGHPRGRLGRISLPKLKLADISLSWAEGEVKMYRMYREIQTLDQNFSLKSSQNFSLSERSKMTPVICGCPLLFGAMLCPIIDGGVLVRQRWSGSYVTWVSNWDWLTVGQGLLSLQQVKGRGGMIFSSVSSLSFIFFLCCPSLSSPLLSLLSLFSLCLGDDTKWPTRLY